MTIKKRVVARKVATIAQEADCGPCYILPADAASYTQMVEQMARGLRQDAFGDFEKGKVFEEQYSANRLKWVRCARAALAAIGIKQPKP